MASRFWRRHAHHAHERAQVDLVPVLVLSGQRIGVERPVMQPALAVGDAEAVVQEGLAAARARPAPPARSYAADVNDERLAGFGASHADGTAEGVPVIHASHPRLEVAAGPAARGRRLQIPAGVEGLEHYRVARLNFEDRRQVA